MNTIVKRRPTNRLFMPHFGNILNEVMNSSLENIIQNSPKGKSTPSVNVKSAEDSYHLEMALPGFSKSDVDIHIDKDVLTISSKKEITEEGKYRLREFNYGSFERKFHLPKNVDQSKIEANFKNGILNLTLALKPEPKPKAISIK